MTRIQKTLFIFLLFTISSLLLVNFSLAKNPIELYFFFGQGCPYCTKMAQALSEIQKQYPELKINPLEIWYNSQNQRLMMALVEVYKVKIEGVPVVFIGDKVIEGSGQAEIFQIKEEVRRCSISSCASPIDKIETRERALALNFKNIGLIGGGLFIILVLIFTFFRKKKIGKL